MNTSTRINIVKKSTKNRKSILELVPIPKNAKLYQSIKLNTQSNVKVGSKNKLISFLYPINLSRF